MSPRWKIPGIARIGLRPAKIGFSAFGGYLAAIGIFLYAIAYLKGAQVLMFVPALFLSVLAFSYFETRRLVRRSSFSFEPASTGFRLFASLPERAGASLRIAFLLPDGTTAYPEPDAASASYRIPGSGCEISVVLRGTFDLFREVRHIGTAEPAAELGVSRASRPDDAFLSIRPYRDGEFLDRVDVLKSSASDRPYVRVWEVSSTPSVHDASGSFRTLSVRSNVPVSVSAPLADAPKIQWRLIALCSLVIAVQWENWWFLLQLAAFAGALRFAKGTLSPRYVGKRFRTAATFVAFCTMLYSSALLLDMTGPVSVFLMEILLVSKFFPADRDESFLFVFLSAFVFATVSFLSFQVWFVAFFAVLLFDLVRLLSETSGYFGKDSLFSQIRASLPKRAFLRTVSLLFVGTAAFFVVLPHGEQDGGLSAALRNVGDAAASVSGYSGELSLSDVSAVKKDPTRKIVMSGFPDRWIPKLRGAYWRGERFSNFVSGRWVRSGDEASLLAVSASGSGATVRMSYSDPGSRTLFFPWIPGSATMSDRSAVPMVRADDPTLFRSSAPLRQESEVLANLPDPDDVPVQMGPFRNAKPLSDEVESLFSAYWDEIPDTVAKTPDSLTKYVRSGFSYSADAPAKNLRSFLYAEKRGHCEYFATTLALTLRHYGFRTTVVTGYRGGEESLFGGSWIVRGSDAHAWVEVWDDGSGWLRFDPTPYDAFSSPSVLLELRNEALSAYDALDLLWYSYAVGYGKYAQRALFAEILPRLPRAAASVFFPLALFAGIRYAVRAASRRAAAWEGQRLVRKLSAVTRSAFPLSVLAPFHPDLVSETRAAVYGRARADVSSIRRLTGRWNAALSDRRARK